MCSSRAQLTVTTTIEQAHNCPSPTEIFRHRADNNKMLTTITTPDVLMLGMLHAYTDTHTAQLAFLDTSTQAFL